MSNFMAVFQSADDLARLVRGITEQGEEFPTIEMLDEALSSYNELRHGQGESSALVTGIDSKLWRAGYVLRRLVAITGFQAELVAYGGDYEVRGTDVHRDCRISIRREEFGLEHIRALTEFAVDHDCKLTMDRHGATLRVNCGRAFSLEQSETVEISAAPKGVIPQAAG